VTAAMRVDPPLVDASPDVLRTMRATGPLEDFTLA